MYRQTRQLKDWKKFKGTVKRTKYKFFDNKIDEITNKKCGPWKLMNWVKKRKLLATEAIYFNGHLCIEISDLWNALHRSFNSAQSCQVNISLLKEIPFKEALTWAFFSRKELLQAIKKYNNSSSPGPDKLSWRHIKMILKNENCIFKLINITNACIDLGYWPNHFKMSTTVIIPKLNKSSYDTPKSFCPIVLLNTLGKFFEKMIGERLQFHSISNNFVHQYQLGGLKYRSTTDADVALTRSG